MTTMDDDTLRRLLAAAPPGPWRTMQSYAGPWWVGRTGPCGCQRPDCDRGFTVVDDEHGAELAALAPALAAEVLRLRAERDELRAVCDDLHIDVVRARDALDDMRVRAERAEAERDALRAAAEEYARSHARSGGGR